MNSVKTVTENVSFHKRSPEWRFLKKPASRLRVDGRKRSFSNTMMSYIMFFYHAIVFRSFYRFRVDGRKRFEYPKCLWVVFFLENEENDLRFQKTPDTCGRGLRFRYFSLSYYRNINVMTSPLFTKRHHYNLRNKSTIVFQKCNLNNRQSLIRC